VAGSGERGDELLGYLKRGEFLDTGFSRGNLIHGANSLQGKEAALQYTTRSTIVYTRNSTEQIILRYDTRSIGGNKKTYPIISLKIEAESVFETSANPRILKSISTTF
jgi:hypothetical protein